MTPPATDEEIAYAESFASKSYSYGGFGTEVLSLIARIRVEEAACAAAQEWSRHCAGTTLSTKLPTSLHATHRTGRPTISIKHSPHTTGQSMFKFPPHKASLHLTHNQHKAYYLTVAQSVAGDDFGYTADCWVSEAEKQKAIETDECWTLQWYPDTPIGFHTASASTLEALLEHVNAEY